MSNTTENYSIIHWGNENFLYCSQGFKVTCLNAWAISVGCISDAGNL